MYKVIMADLLALIKHRRTIFLAIVLSLACSFTIFSMMTGVVSYVIKGFESGGRNYTFTLDLKSQPIAALDVYEQVKQTGRVRNIVMIQAQNGNPMIVGWYGGDNLNQWFVLDEGRFFAENESNDDIAVVSAAFYPGIAFDEKKYTVSIAESEFPIVGVGILPNSALLCLGTGTEVYQRYYPQNSQTYYDHAGQSGNTRVAVRQLTAILPAETFLRHGLVANILRIEFYLSDSDELASVSDNLKQLFPFADIVEPVLPKQFWQNRMNSEVWKAIAIIGCGFINMIALFTYWLVAYRRTHSLYRMLGADKSYIVKTILIEWLALMVIGYAVGILFQRLLQPVMEALYIYTPFTWENTVGIFSLLYLLSILLMVPQVKKNASIDLEVL